MRSGQNGEIAQLVKLSGAGVGSKGEALVLNSNRADLHLKRGLNAGHKFNVDVEALLRNPTYESHNNSRLICTAGAKETGAERRMRFNLRSVSIPVGKLRFKGLPKRD